MKVAQFSDLHYCGKHLDWVDRAMGFAVLDAIARGAEVGILSGDSFDTEVPLQHPAVYRLIERVQMLADHMPVLILQGTFSHDRPGCLNVFKSLRTKFPVHVADKTGMVGLYGSPLHCDGWRDPATVPAGFMSPRLLVSALPSVNRAEIQANNPDEKTSAYLDRQFAEWNPLNQDARAAGIPTVLVSHGTVNGCVTESKQAMISPDHEFGTAALFSAGASAVMLGHIHAHQGWETPDGRRIAYPGSITKLIYGHAASCGYLLWDVDPYGAEYTLVETPHRQLIDIEFSGPPDLQQLQRRLATCKGAFVRLRYQVDEEHRQAVDQQGLRDILAAAGLADYKVEGKINPIQRTRASGISGMTSIEERLKKWCELTSTAPAPLLQRLTTLQQGDEA